MPLKMSEMTINASNGASGPRIIGFFTPTAMINGLINLPSGAASSTPSKIPNNENATRIAPCRNPSPANIPSHTKAKSQIVMLSITSHCPEKARRKFPTHTSLALGFLVELDRAPAEQPDQGRRPHQTQQ